MPLVEEPVGLAVEVDDVDEALRELDPELADGKIVAVPSLPVVKIVVFKVVVESPGGDMADSKLPVKTAWRVL